MKTIKFNNYSIYERGNSWYIYVPQKITGKTIRTSLHTSNQTYATQLARKFFQDLEGIKTKDTNSFINNAMDFLSVNNNPLHREYMNRCFIPFFSDKIGNKAKINDINKLTNSDILKYIDYRRKIPSQRKNNNQNIPVKPTTIIRENNTLRTFFNWCYKNERIKKSLVVPTIKAKENVFDENGNPIFDDLSGKRSNFTPDEIKKIFQTLLKEIKNEVNRHNKRRKILLYYYIHILFATGLRMCELRNLNWNQFIPEYKSGGLLKDVYNSKQHQKRDVALSPHIVKLMTKLKRHQQNFCINHNLEFDENKIKIISICNCNLETNTYSIKQVKELDNGFRRLLNRCGFEHLNKKVLYSFRHSYTSTLIEQKTPIINIAQQCGTSIKMIENYYNQSSHLTNMDALFIPYPDFDKAI